MALLTETIEYSFACDGAGCDVVVRARSHDPADMPTGYHVHLLRVTEAGNHYTSGPLFFHDKDCLVNAVQWQISSLVLPGQPRTP